MKAKESNRYRPQGLDKTLSYPDYGIECFYSNELLVAIFYSGKKNKPDFYYRYKSVDRMMERINEIVTNIIEDENRKNRIKEEEKKRNMSLVASEHFSVGDIVVNTWGWEQTNQDYYQVVEVLNKKIKVVEIGRNYEETGFMSGNSMPEKNKFLIGGEKYLLSLKYSGDQVIICNPKSFYYFHKWNGEVLYESHYA